MLNETAIEWLMARGIDPAIAEAHGVQSTGRKNGGDWLAFPYQRSGKTVTTKYRRIDAGPEDQKFSQDAGAPYKLCWNEDSLRQGEGPVVITEGEMDTLAVLQADFDRVISIPDGAPAHEVEDDGSDKWAYVPDLIDRLRGCRDIVIAADGDQPGANLRAYLERRLGKARCRYLRYPPGCKDANDVLRKNGKDALRRLIEGAPHVKVSGLAKLRDMPPPQEVQVFKAHLGGPDSGFDDHVSILRGQLSVWTGIPGHGKSTLVKAICMELGRYHHWKFAIGAFEDDVQTDFRRDVATYIAKCPHDALSDDQWAKADEYLDERFAFIVEEEMGPRMTIDWLIEAMEGAVVRYGVNMIVIDPWSKLDHARGRDESENDYTGRVLNELKRFARAFDVHVAVVAHPRKAAKKADGSYDIPGGYEISGSSHWFNLVDLGVTSYREVRENGDIVAMIVVWKVKRHTIMGSPGVVRLSLNKDTGRYSDYYNQEAG